MNNLFFIRQKLNISRLLNEPDGIENATHNTIAKLT
jgi:hypothetical protein